MPSPRARCARCCRAACRRVCGHACECVCRQARGGDAQSSPRPWRAAAVSCFHRVSQPCMLCALAAAGVEPCWRCANAAPAQRWWAALGALPGPACGDAHTGTSFRQNRKQAHRHRWTSKTVPSPRWRVGHTPKPWLRGQLPGGRTETAHMHTETLVSEVVPLLLLTLRGRVWTPPAVLARASQERLAQTRLLRVPVSRTKGGAVVRRASHRGCWWSASPRAQWR
mmetsp:Transcript_5090/g.15469  ORF Transcript_5090/g.15469 Transcript_5090/m.15469 type:complete len:225 (+) Transcript_5090:1599-2273(+)